MGKKLEEHGKQNNMENKMENKIEPKQGTWALPICLQAVVQKENPSAFKGSYTIEVTLLLMIILSVFAVTIDVCFDLYQQCQQTAVIAEEIKQLQAAENFRKAQTIQKLWKQIAP